MLGRRCVRWVGHDSMVSNNHLKRVLNDWMGSGWIDLGFNVGLSRMTSPIVCLSRTEILSQFIFCRHLTPTRFSASKK